MSNYNDDTTNNETTKKEYAIGYGKPPEAFQYERGQSGNPKGRPKGSKNISTLLREELEVKISVTEAGHRQEITKAAAMVKALVNKALSGDARSTALVMTVNAAIEQQIMNNEAITLDANSLSETDEVLVQRFYDRMQQEPNITEPLSDNLEALDVIAAEEELENV